MDIHEVEQLLKSHLHRDNWLVVKTVGGLSKYSYVAESNNYKVFVKFEDASRAIIRLSELGIVPPIMIRGVFNHRPFFIQQFVDHHYPTSEWFTNHLPLLASMIAKYHRDTELINILTDGYIASYADHVASELSDLEYRIAEVSPLSFDASDISYHYQLFKKQSLQLNPTHLVPIHADPNYKNFLVSKEQLFIVDWDDIFLSDPLFDISRILWENVPKSKWAEFFASYGLATDDAVMDRFYWWTACNMLRISLYFAEINNKEVAINYSNYFIAAMDREIYPRAAFDETGNKRY